MMVVDGDVLRWEPEEQFQWSQWYERNEKMDLKRAISRVETIMRRPSWQGTEQSRAIDVVLKAARTQLPPEPRDHLHLYRGEKDGWQINSDQSGQLQTKETAESWHDFSPARKAGRGSLVVKVPV